MDFPFRTLRRQFRPARSGIDKCWHPYRSTHPGHCWHRFTARAFVGGLATLDYGCVAVLIERNDLPKHPLWHSGSGTFPMTCAASVWPVHGSGSAHAARVLAGTIKGVENVVYRQSMLLSPEDFSVIFDKLESIVGDIGKPGGSLIGDGDKRGYRYSPFHRFEISFTRAAVEPLILLIILLGRAPVF